ncbi:expressed unknown protein [Seminavis robusta]|uniref:Uncharacterized protein n=1 Tax=Seminavis robusta TaxID=568900 RepID=A0A9N8E2F1_9STRA|nr:expressed unknown protein [Seminavis robusta]|eukprot:Sro582_g170430.1 n/a (348) ;mRNA; r:10358-11401
MNPERDAAGAAEATPIRDREDHDEIPVNNDDVAVGDGPEVEAADRAVEDDQGNQHHQDQGAEDENDVAGDDQAAARGHPIMPVVADEAWTMEITDQERQWACTIKTAIESCPDLDKLSDFEYCQFAIVDQDNVEGAVDRATSLQGLCQEYDIYNSLEDAMTRLDQFVKLLPEMFLSFTSNHRSGGYAIVTDMKGYDQKALKTEKGWKTHIAGLYYLFHALNPDFHSIRHGITIVQECEGYSILANVDFKTARTTSAEFYSVYPFNTHELKYYHTNMFFNMTMSSCKAVLPKSVSSKFHVGCFFPPGRLDRFYNIPDPQTAMERTIMRMQHRSSVRRRYENGAQFQLS